MTTPEHRDLSPGGHTPGPWHRNIPPATKYTTVWSGRNTHVAHVVVGDLSAEEVEANIRLIAAAPALLAAALLVRDVRPTNWDEGDDPELEAAYRALDAAIRAAQEGVTP